MTNGNSWFDGTIDFMLAKKLYSLDKQKISEEGVRMIVDIYREKHLNRR
jgi:hypothetical protein